MLEDLATRLVVPLVLGSEFGRPARILNPVYEISGKEVVVSIAEMAGISKKILGRKVASLQEKRSEIINAIDFLVTGI